MSRIIGSILLIIAMSIGGGLLSLPIVTAASGFFYSTLLLIVIWLIMTIGALFILEVCLNSPRQSNLISIAKDTLGLPGQVFTWIFYILMLYCILCVYISGGTDLVNSIWKSMHIPMHASVSTLLFVLILGGFVWHGINLVDKANRALMFGKMLAYFLLIALLIPVVHLKNLPSGPFLAISNAIMPAIFSFGFAIVIPSLCDYLEYNVKALRRVVLIGSFIPLVCFIIWNYTVQGVIPQAELISISHSGKVISQLNLGLSAIGNPWVITITHIFTTICLLTAFLAVSLSLSDVIANGVQQKKEGIYKWLIYGLTFLPPLIIVLFYPYIFITAIRYAGILVVIILILLPTLMALRSRQAQKSQQTSNYQVPGKLTTIIVMLLFSVLLLLFAVMHL